MENIKNINEKMEELKQEYEGDLLNIEVITDYDRGYITDLYSEIADSNTEIYTKKLFDMAWDLYSEDYIDRVISEFGETDLINIFMAADYLRHVEELYNNDEIIRLYYALAVLEDNYNQNIKNMEDIIEDIEDNNLDFDRLEDIEDYVINIINIYQ